MISRRRCKVDCILAPYLSYPGSIIDYHPIHKIYGTKNFTRLFRKIPLDKRQQAINSYLYEARKRCHDPVLGSVSYIINLETQVEKLREVITSLEARLYKGPPAQSNPDEHLLFPEKPVEHKEKSIDIEVEVQERPPENSNRYVELPTDFDSQLVDVEVQASPKYSELLTFTPSSSWVNSALLDNSESSSVSNSPNSPLSPTAFIQPVTQDNPTGSHPTWAELIRFYQAEHFSNASSQVEGSNNSPMVVEPISTIHPSPETHPYSFFNLSCINTKRVDTCSSSQSNSSVTWPSRKS
jgi:Protein of unknown function DUF260.